MQLIPVMDLLDGRVVRAVAGERSDYRSVRSCLTDSAEPAAVAAGLLRLAPFRRFYVADLDAICRGGSDRHLPVLEGLCAGLGRAGATELWLDAGGAPWVGDLAAAAGVHGVRVVPVVGTESLAGNKGYSADADGVLSIDYRRGMFLGPVGLDGDAAGWPGRVVVMELAAVGTAGGPALLRLRALQAAARAAGRDDVRFYAAGGVRDAADLETLAAAGAAGVLVASALHDGRLDAAALRPYLQE